jgi:prepilin-type processing-associated H-X9-DG protein
MSNVRQILLADNMYADENDDRLVPYWDHYTAGHKFTDLLQRYVKMGSTAYVQGRETWLLCPSQTTRDVWGYVITGIGPIYGGGNNFHVMHADGNIAPFQVSAKRNEIKKPSEMPSWMDIDGGSSQGYASYCMGCYPGGVVIPYATDPNNFGLRHNGGANVGFVDGHVGWVPRATLQAACVSGGTDFFRHYDNSP